MTKYKLNNIPQHIAIILDGNGRWAKSRGLPRIIGHDKGADAVVKTVISAKKIGVKYLSMYAFSTENWKREQSEIEHIFALIEKYLEEKKDKLNENNIRIIVSGNTSNLPYNLKNKIDEVIELSKNNDGIVINLCINYGSIDEINRAINLICLSKKDNITYEDLKSCLYTCDIPNPDFVIRTSGEQRLSNFMLLQIAYAELYFPKVLWPDFNEKHLIKAIKVYQKRSRRFGGV